MPNDVCVLFLTAILQEDLAIFAASFVVLDHRLSIASALAAVYLGVITNNFTVYGLGIAARRIPWLRRRLINDNVEQLRSRLQRRMLLTLTLCRFVPGLMSPTLLGCGWLGISPLRFVPAALLAAAVYVPLILTAVILLGESALRRLGEKAWWVLPILAAIVLLGWMFARLRRPRA